MTFPKDLEIIIPTMHRVNEQRTWFNLPPEIRRHTTLVCPKEDKHGLIEALGKDAKIVVEPKSVMNIEQKRAWIVKKVVKAPKFMMLDDDLSFHCRIKNNTLVKKPGRGGKTGSPSSAMLVETFNAYSRALDEYEHGGISQRFMSHTYKPDSRGLLTGGVRLLQAWGGKTQTFQDMLEFGRVDLLGDVDWVLQLLGRGYDNFNIAFLQVQGVFSVNQRGGCPEYRRSLKRNTAIDKMADMWEGYVKTVDYRNPVNPLQARGIKIQWKKLLKDAPLASNKPRDARLKRTR